MCDDLVNGTRDRNEMLSDARKLENGKVLQTTVCIIGAGPAGITMALEFERRGISTVLLESGGFKPDSGTMDLYRGENVGLPYEFGDGFRSRFLGGGSNCWGGWCRPLDAEDFDKRDWVPDSGWPFGLDELRPYYERAHPVLQLGPFNYDLSHWVKAVDRPTIRRMPLDRDIVSDSVSQFSPPMRFGRAYRGALSNARHVQVLIHANVTSIDPDATGRNVQRVQVRTLTGQRFEVQARHYVLAAGGMENARILLSSTRGHAEGLGNANGLVGRYFMDHPRLLRGRIVLNEAWQRNKLYDIMYHYLNREVKVGRTHFAAQMSLRHEVQKREQLLNARVWLSSIFPGEGTAASEALIRMKHRLHRKVDPQHTLLGDLGILARDPANAMHFFSARQLRPLALLMHFRMVKEARFQMICEPTPDPTSRVSLSDSVDALGMRRVKVDWRLDDRVRHTFDRTLAIVGSELQKAGIGTVTQDEPLLGRNDWPESLEGTWHHMGTTRMHDSPKHGVVDRHGAIHGMSNMFVSGSSVFPTAGANFPTFTLVALALRQADHIAARLSVPDATARTASPTAAALEPQAAVLARTAAT